MFLKNDNNKKLIHRCNELTVLDVSGCWQVNSDIILQPTILPAASHDDNNVVDHSSKSRSWRELCLRGCLLNSGMFSYFELLLKYNFNLFLFCVLCV